MKEKPIEYFEDFLENPQSPTEACPLLQRRVVELLVEILKELRKN